MNPALEELDPIAQVTSFLLTMQQRDLAAAEGYLHPDFSMHFPGTDALHSLSALVDWSRTRYRFVEKTLADCELINRTDTTVVFVRGTLSGEWPDGTPFSGIRFIDRFELRDGLLWRQDVWNDLAEAQQSQP